METPPLLFVNCGVDIESGLSGGVLPICQAQLYLFHCPLEISIILCLYSLYTAYIPLYCLVV
jgi:hypothetical protein